MDSVVWLVTFAILCRHLNGVRSGQNVKRHLIISNQIYTAQNKLTLTCQDACDESGEILGCQIRINGNCLTQYYLACRKKETGECSWQTINSSCSDPDNTNVESCRKATKARLSGYSDQKVKSDQENRFLRSDGILSGLKERFNDLTRKESTDGHALPLYGQRASMVSTSGNGHAFALDGDNLAESHYGSPPVYSTLGSNGQHSAFGDLLSFPFSFVSSFARKPRKDQDGVIAQATNFKLPIQTEGFASVPFSGGFDGSDYYQPGYAQGYGSYNYPMDNNYQGTNYPWNGRVPPTPGKISSPFSAIFNSVGLQDPMLMLQYLPVGTIFRENDLKQEIFGDLDQNIVDNGPKQLPPNIMRMPPKKGP